MRNNIALLMGERRVTVHTETLSDTLGPKELLIKIDACNLCTSEYGIYSGDRTANFPYSIGHEWAGHILKFGNEVTRFEVGDLVTGCYEFDATSEAAQMGNSSSSPRTYAFDAMNKNGYYGRFRACAQYLVTPEISTFKMNPDLDPSEAGFLEPLATVVSGIKKMDLKVTDRVLVIGGGTMGILNGLVAKSYGSTVVVTEFMDKKITVARKMGLNTVKLTAKSVDEQILEIQTQTSIKTFDKVIVAVGVTSAYEQAFKILKKNDGTVLLFAAGYPSPDLSISANEIHYRKMNVVGTYTANYQDFLDASILLNEGKVRVTHLIENRVALDDIEDAMNQAIVPGAFRVSVVC